MGNIVDVDLKVDPEYLNKSVHEIVKAGIIQALGDPSDIIKSAVDSVFLMKVDRNGKPTNSSYDSRPYLDWLSTQVIEDTVREVIKETIEERKEELVKVIKAQIMKKSFQSQVSTAFIKAMIDSASNAWLMPITVNFEKDEDKDY